MSPLERMICRLIARVLGDDCAVCVAPGFVLEIDGYLGEYADVWTSDPRTGVRIWSGDWTRPWREA